MIHRAIVIWNRRLLVVTIVAALALASASGAQAATASLVADINPSGVGDSTVYANALVALPGKALFLAGAELWASDGTVLGTVALHEFCGGAPCGDYPKILGTAGKLAFLAADGQLWSTDGTVAGTIPFATARPSDIAVSSGGLFFLDCDGNGCTLRRSDGTAAGTVALRDHLDSRATRLVAAGTGVFFLTDSPHGYHDVLWHSDGTAAGTALLHTFDDPDVGLSDLTPASGRLFFFATDPDHGEELWASDGSVAGTVRLTDFANPSPFPQQVLKGLDDEVAFIADDTTNGPELWVSDGTLAGTRAATHFSSLVPFGHGLQNSEIAKAGNRLVFPADDGLTGYRLWTSGGTPATTVPLSGCPGGCPAVSFVVLQAAGGKVYFLGSDLGHGTELWVSDGTGPGTRRLGDFCPGPCGASFSGVYAALGAVYFEAVAGTNSLWKSDGTAAGTVRLTTFGENRSLSFLPVTAAGRLFFLPPSSQVWTSDGTPGGTRPVTALGFDGGSSTPSLLTPLAGSLLFSATDGQLAGPWVSGGTAASTQALPGGENGPPPGFTVVGSLAFFVPVGDIAGTLWRTGGTAGSTRPLATSPRADPRTLTAFGGKLLFVGSTDDHPLPAFWTSDGTDAGTALLFSPPGSVQEVRSVLAAGDRFYFLSPNTSERFNLWESDGTAAGTRQLTQVEQVGLDPNAFELVRLGGTVYFPGEGTFGTVLWKSDGTPAGTVPVLPLEGGTGGGPANLFAWNGALYFFGYLDAARGSAPRGLFRSDGTTAGTVLLAPAAPHFTNNSFTGSEPAFFTPFGGQLLFAADDSIHGIELWRTDGTAAGTALLRDIDPGAASSTPTGLVVAGNGLLYFAADDGVHGAELWQSDGTTAGTRLVEDLAPGVAASGPRELTVSGDRLYFSADDGVWGRELWVYPLATAPSCQPSDTALCLNGGRFRVEADWLLPTGRGVGHAVALTGDTGYFWFFAPANVEVVLKVLDGRGVNGNFWTFYGALSNVEYALTVTDTVTGAVRRYLNPSQTLASVADTAAFLPDAGGRRLSIGPAGTPVPVPAAASQAASATAISPCVPGPARLCLQGGRFAVEARWRDFQNRTGVGTAVDLSGDTGYFWFFDPGNVEAVVKVLDGRPVNGKLWVFYGALSNVFYTLTVTDTVTGAVKTYTNPAGRLASVADTAAF